MISDIAMRVSDKSALPCPLEGFAGWCESAKRGRMGEERCRSAAKSERYFDIVMR